MTPQNRRETTTQYPEAIRIDEEGGQDVKSKYYTDFTKSREDRRSRQKGEVDDEMGKETDILNKLCNSIRLIIALEKTKLLTEK